jgi:hypothetical protein
MKTAEELAREIGTLRHQCKFEESAKLIEQDRREQRADALRMAAKWFAPMSVDDVFIFHGGIDTVLRRMADIEEKG